MDAEPQKPDGRSVHDGTSAEKPAHRFELVLKAIELRPYEAHTVSSLATLAGMSRSRFAASFRGCFGRSPIEFLRTARLNHAAYDLRTSSLLIKTIGARAGYDSRTSFTQAFRRLFGTSPADFRASHQEKPPVDIHAISVRLRASSQAPESLAWEVNLVSGAVWWSEGTFAALGYSQRRQLIADVARFYERIHPSDRSRIAKGVAAACENGQLTWSDQFDFMNAHGAYVRIANACLIYRNASGMALRLIGVMQIVGLPAD